MSCETKSLSNSSKSNPIKDTACEEQKKTDLSVNEINDNLFKDKVTNWLNACEPQNYNSSDIINENQDLPNISENTELTDTLFFSNTPENDLDIQEMDFIYNNDEPVPDNNTPLNDLFPIVIQIPCTTDLQITEHDTPAKVSNVSTNPEYAEPVQTNPSEQNKFLLTMMKVKCPIRTDRRKGNKEEKTVIVYYLPTEKGDLLQVCSIAFTDITRITKRRGFSIARNLLKVKIVIIIEKIQAVVTCSPVYLWQEISNQSTASLSKYYDVFCKNFNLSFGHPRQDVCSFCSETSIKMKNEIDIKKKVDLEDVLLEHKNKSKCFFQMMAEKLPNTVQVCFDMMQNQPLPKLSVTDTFYSRQAWVYNLTFVIMSENDQIPKTTSFYEDIFKLNELESIEDSAINEESACIYSEDTSY
ncbi:hypothetical protein QTP88_027143 [Uroleucon formosanum]